MTQVELLMVGAVALIGGVFASALWQRYVRSTSDWNPYRRPQIVAVGWAVIVVGAAASVVGWEWDDPQFAAYRLLVSAVAVIAVWSGLQLCAYGTASRGNREDAHAGFVSWLGTRLAREWPVLVVFLLAPGISALRSTEFVLDRLFLVPLGLAVLAGWWLLEWQIGEDAHPLRNPLGLLADVLNSLWRYKLLLIGFLVCVLVSAAVQWDYFLRYYPEWTTGSRGFSALKVSPSLNDILSALRFGTGLPEQTVPKVAMPPLGQYTVHLLHAILAGWLIWLLAGRPAWLPAAVRKRLGWPVGLLLLGVCVAIVVALSRFEPLIWRWLSFHPTEGLLLTLEPVSRPQALICTPIPKVPAQPLGYPLAFPASAPLLALVWWIILRIARHRPWSLRQATRVMAHCWGSIAALMLLWVAAPVLGVVAWWFPHPAGVVLGIASEIGEDPMLIALALAPWLIVDRRMRLLPALVESWRLATSRARDVLVFAIRYWLLMSLAATAIHVVTHSPGFAYTFTEPLLQGVAEGLGVLTMAAAYVALQGGPLRTAPRPRPDRPGRADARGGL